MIIDTNNIPPSLTGGILRLLCAIHDNPNSTCAEIAEAVDRSTAAITGLMDHAEILHLAYRLPHESDRRKWSLELTDIGQAMVEKLKPEGVAA